MSGVRCPVLGVRDHMSGVTIYMYIYIYFFFYKQMALVSGGSVITRDYPVNFFFKWQQKF